MRSISQNHNDSIICWRNKQWRFYGIYDYPDSNQKCKTWELIRKLQGLSDLPWILGGDFNEILSNTENEGVFQRENKYIEDFRLVLDECELKDIKSSKDLFTWYGTRRGFQIWDGRGLTIFCVILPSRIFLTE